MLEATLTCSLACSQEATRKSRHGDLDDCSFSSGSKSGQYTNLDTKGSKIGETAKRVDGDIEATRSHGGLLSG